MIRTFAAGSNALDDRRASVDVVLQNVSIGIKPPSDFIGDLILPPHPQALSEAKMKVWGTEAYRIRDDRLADFSEPSKLDIQAGLTTVNVDGHGLMAPVSDRHQQEALQGPLNYDLAARETKTVTAQMLLSREKLQADLVTAAATYASANKCDLNANGMKADGTQSAGNHQWDNGSNDPIDDLTAAIESVVPDATGQRPNLVWLGQPVWAALVRNTAFKNRVFGTANPQGVPTLAQLATIIGVDRVIVGRALSRTADATTFGNGGTVTKLWGKNAGCLYVAPDAGDVEPAFGYTIEQSVFGGATSKIITIRDEKMGASGGYWVKRAAFYTPAALYPNAGFLFYNVIA